MSIFNFFKRASYRPRVEVHAYKTIDGVPHILATKQNGEFAFPGGGIEEKQNAQDAAKKEMLEEAGFKINKPKKFDRARRYTMSQRWQDQSLLRRGKSYRGVANQIIQAELGDEDTHLLGKEGDEMEGLRLYPVSEVANHLQWNTRKLVFMQPDDWSQRVIPSIRSLREIEKKK